MTKLRVSTSVIGFKERALKTWGLEGWEGIDDPCDELVFFGLYHERDYSVFEMYQGKRIVFWCGGDILRVMTDYEKRRILKNYPLAEHYCENEVEQNNLRDCGIKAKIVPSFLDSVDSFPISFKPPYPVGVVGEVDPNKKLENWKVWMCTHPEREDEYGIELAKRMADKFPEIEFHIYGVDKPEYENILNVIYHGQVPEYQFNEEIQKYHCGFRPNFHDGNSEVAMKSIFLGQYPITRIKYPDIWNYTNESELIDCFKKLMEQTKPNYDARIKWMKRINQFPWCYRKYA